MALIRYPATFPLALGERPVDLRAAVSDDRAAGPSGTFARYFLQARGDGVEWRDAADPPPADGAWHVLPNRAGVILAVPETGAQRPWLRATGPAAASVVISGANAPPEG